jgi:hypothetical protein
MLQLSNSLQFTFMILLHFTTVKIVRSMLAQHIVFISSWKVANKV